MYLKKNKPAIQQENADFLYKLANNQSENRDIAKYFAIKLIFLKINDGIGSFYESFRPEDWLKFRSAGPGSNKERHSKEKGKQHCREYFIAAARRKENFVRFPADNKSCPVKGMRQCL